ncbi:hypothetical protein ALT761_02176 [Alteromonas sp. 76-1]|jgi:hypothetical protein|uniref:GIY-YIG nuclease family protein n=1 Tax=Alteromonas TaxID=226 RepID=UPI000509F960|nr:MULTISPECIES: GIY-YIG nuclease family protein [unclassified Alteromonas]MDO6566009.1 GIY-YIG nuclease family protein [Alteromonas sp. 1_MG-2023]VEL97176.1 hypothetical protein ALT761_02176 [Alteromonas sp. 76-1]
MTVSSYEKDLAICEHVFNHFILSDQFFGFVTIGILAKYANKNNVYSSDFKLLVRERGFDLKSKCNERGVYFSRSCSKALANKHPVKLLRCAEIQSVIAESGIKGALSQLKIKRSIIDQLFYEMLGSVQYRTNFLELGWDIADLPHLTTPLYKQMVKYIVNNQVTDKHALRNAIVRDMNDGKKWWLHEHLVNTDKPGFIYVAMLSEENNLYRVKIGQTEREIKKRHSEHLRAKKVNIDTTFLCKYVESPVKEESAILSYFREHGQLISGREEFIINNKLAATLKDYLVSDVSFATFVSQAQ